MGIERKLDSQAVEAAEFARKNNGVIIAAEMAAIGLGLTSSPLTGEEVAELAKDPEQRAVLACLARIYADSLKTVANQAKLPHQALPPLEKAAWAIKTVYRNSDLQTSLLGVETDHRGRQHHFLPEMARDEAKTLLAASVLYSPQEADQIIQLGEKLLEKTYQSLPEDHPTKPLIGIEIQLSKAGRGVAPDNGQLCRDFWKLVYSDMKTNPHRVATVASWLVVWGEKLKNDQLKNPGWEIFSRIINKHPEWQFMTDLERQKQAKQRIRRLLFRVTTPITTSSEKRKTLKQDLLGEEK